MNVIGVDFGNDPPVITSAALVSTNDEIELNDDCVAVQFDFTYSEVIKITVNVVFRWGALLPVTINVKELAGEVFSNGY